MTTLIPANTPIPTKKEQVFSTAADNQTEVEIKVLQGDRPMASDNKLLGRFQLVGIPPAPKAVPQIEVGFDIDANGIVNVSAKDKATSKEQRIQIKSDGGLSKDEIARMKREAELNADNDRIKKEATEMRNKAESLVFGTEKNIDDYKDILEESEKTQIREKIAKVREALTSNNNDQIQNAVKELESTTAPIFTRAYQAASEKRSGPPPPPPGGSDSGSTSTESGSESQGEFKDVR
jgi:molecular chaperone DnaK